MFAEVSAEQNGFQAQLKLVDSDSNVRGDRTLHVTGRCDELIVAMALTMSLVIDPMSAMRGGPPPDAPPSEKPVDLNLANAPRVAGSDEPSPEPPPEAPPPREPVVVTIGAGPRASIGTAPAPSVGGAIGADLRRGRLVAGLEGRADLPASTNVSLGTVKSWLLAATVLGGLREGPIFVLGEVSVGRIAASGSDLAVSKDDAALYLAAGARIGAAFGLGDRVEGRVFGEGLGTLVRNTLSISGQEAYQYPVASAGIGAMVAYRFP
jgi:hypothetical protein